MKTAENFMDNVFAALINKFPSATIQYQHKELSDTHFFKVTSLAIFQSEEFIDFRLDIYDEYHYSKLDGGICFITENALVELKKPSKTYFPKLEINQTEKIALVEENIGNLNTYIQNKPVFRFMANSSFQNMSEPSFDNTAYLTKKLHNMKVTEKSKSSFQLNEINLRKSIFEIVDSNMPLDNFEIAIGVDKKRYGIENKDLECALTITLSVEDREAFKLSVTMVGKFTIEGESDFNTDEFLNINAPSIIFPYIRQHVRTLSLEAGIKPVIILPVINFVVLQNSEVTTNSLD